MKFKYVETCAAGFVELKGVVFPQGEEVEVEDKDLISKLKSNSHFESVKAEKVKKNAGS